MQDRTGMSLADLKVSKEISVPLPGSFWERVPGVQSLKLIVYIIVYVCRLFFVYLSLLVIFCVINNLNQQTNLQNQNLTATKTFH